jgi:hypothetical protein
MKNRTPETEALPNVAPVITLGEALDTLERQARRALARKLLSLFPEIEAPQDDPGRYALELGRLIFAGGAGFDALAQPHELRLALVRSRVHHTLQLIHGGS